MNWTNRSLFKIQQTGVTTEIKLRIKNTPDTRVKSQMIDK